LTGTTFSLASVENLPVGATTPSTGKFTTLEATTSLKTPALETGSLKVTGGNPALGSVLTSDASGTATWQAIPKLSKIIYVAESGGDYPTITAALNSITDAIATKPYLVRVAPGVYAEQVTMKPYVSIEGAGEGTTIIKFTGSNISPQLENTSATVIGANNAELRFLTVQSDGTGKIYAIAICNRAASPKLSHLTLIAAGVVSTGCNSGLSNYSSSAPVLTNLTINAAGGVDYSFGVYNYSSSSPTIYSSRITGVTNSVNNTNSTSKIANTMLDGPVTTGSTCIGTYNASFGALSTTCQ
jgi:hypothetical protein